jgi:hypothetical protein
MGSPAFVFFANLLGFVRMASNFAGAGINPGASLFNHAYLPEFSGQTARSGHWNQHRLSQHPAPASAAAFPDVWHRYENSSQ